MSSQQFAEYAERTMRGLEMVAAGVLVIMFGFGVFDLGLSIVQLVLTGRFTRPDAVIELIDIALLLFIIVEIFHTVMAYTRSEPVTRIVIDAGLIAITRKIISFRPATYPSVEDALVMAGAYGLLLAVLVIAFFVTRHDAVSVTENVTH